MARFAARLLALLSVASPALAGCHSVNAPGVPWYRGIPASFLSRNSLEAEVWRQQRTGVVEGWPTPPQPVVREPLPMAGEDASTSSLPSSLRPGAAAADSSRTPTEAKTRPAGE
jgi:hypothetical protein